MKTKRFSDSRRRLIRHGIDTGGALLATAALPRTLMAAPTEPSGAGPANETLKTIHSLRTIHGDFSDKAVPDETIQLIISASVRAANASAYQSYSIIVVKEGETIRKLTTGAVCFSIAWTTRASTMPPPTWGIASRARTWSRS
jgi:hypothetical protein